MEQMQTLRQHSAVMHNDTARDGLQKMKSQMDHLRRGRPVPAAS